MRRALVGVGFGVFAIVACGHDLGTPSHERVGTTAQPIIAAPEEITGADLGDKELVLTFDDGPGPMDVTGELADFLSKRTPPIRATFFVNGACVKATALPNDSCATPVANADAVLAKIRATGHWVANHTTTHRDMASLTGAQVLADITETDTNIAAHLVFNRLFFRAPYGSWDTQAFNGVKDSPMNKYAGPVYWTAGGSANIAADWACWEGINGDGTGAKLTTDACTTRYVNEIKALPKKNGIVLFHDAKGDTANHNTATGVGNTVDLVKKLVPLLEADGYKFKTLADVPSLAAVLPKCTDAACLECSAADAKKCLLCPSGKAPDAAGACVASGTDADAGPDPGTSSSSSSSSSSSTSSSTSTGGIAPGTEAPAPAEEGCNATGGGKSESSGIAAAALALGLAISLRSKRRRT